MAHITSGLLALVTLAGLTGAARAETPEPLDTVPKVLSLVSSKDYHLLSNDQMSKMVGTSIVNSASGNGTFQVTGTLGNGQAYTHTIKLIQGSNSVYKVQYIVPGTAGSVEGIGFEYNNILGVVWPSQAQGKANLALYSVNPDGSLSGKWTTLGIFGPLATANLTRFPNDPLGNKSFHSRVLTDSVQIP